jgi:hypothetical protein
MAAISVQGVSAQQLPPPPNVGNPSPSAPLPATLPPPSSAPGIPASNERVYSAPGSWQSSSGVYRVIVESSDPFILQQVRFVKPDAFIQTLNGRRVIQAGIFSNEANARQQANLLASQGIASGIVGGGYNSGVGSGGYNSGGIGMPPQVNAPRGYYAIVPSSQRELSQLRFRATQLGVPNNAVYLRSRPLGPHMAIGPYSNARDAEKLSSYLRSRGNLDSRVHFTP